MTAEELDTQVKGWLAMVQAKVEDISKKQIEQAIETLVQSRAKEEAKHPFIEACPPPPLFSTAWMQFPILSNMGSPGIFLPETYTRPQMYSTGDARIPLDEAWVI